ncbi:hypothetical protein PV327_004569 [Microctonus hyperodae]|uniref:Uncharacterized protein n=1 Tax=Microctonus hyperodae TaxID=165561 RepID=A0AA39FCP9_MICHY|nr:hypothetical protein PV327_004569 [Microctonus hyperodae]
MSGKDIVNEHQLDIFSNRILQWKTKWLKDDKYNNLPPPIVDTKELKSTLLSYESYDEYYDIMNTLLILEFWSQLKNDYDNEVVKKSVEGSVILNSADYTLSDKPKTRNFYIQLKVILPKMRFENEKTHPLRGDLVMFKNPHSNEELFAYVENLQNKADKDDYEDAILVYTLLTKPTYLELSCELRIETITTMSSFITLFKSLLNIPNSLLETLILRPNVDEYELLPLDKDNFPPLIITEDNLNLKQLEVIARIKNTVEKSTPKISMIQGPPGTGKSQVIVNIIASLFIEKSADKILVCAHSNQAIDEVVLRLLELKKIFSTNGISFRVVRVGQEDKMSDLAKTVTPSALVHTMGSAGRFIFGKNQYEKEQYVLKYADVIASTLTSCCNNQMTDIFSSNGFIIPVCLIDEAGQATELATTAPLILGVQNLILIGDTKQLRPTVLSTKATELGFDTTLFARAEKIFARDQSRNPIIMLDTQYRMVNSIAYWPNRYFYSGAIQNGPIVYPELYVTPYKLLNHDSRQDDAIYSNGGEAKLIINLIYTIVTEANLGDGISIGVITPYKKQQKLITILKDKKFKCIPEEIQKKIKTCDINTVDSFQGSERDVIIISCVRSRGIGFLNDPNRLCVSLTRAKRCLIICGNFSTFEKNPMWRNLLYNAKTRDVYASINYNIDVKDLKQIVIEDSVSTLKLRFDELFK